MAEVSRHQKCRIVCVRIFLPKTRIGFFISDLFDFSFSTFAFFIFEFLDSIFHFRLNSTKNLKSFEIPFLASVFSACKRGEGGCMRLLLSRPDGTTTRQGSTYNLKNPKSKTQKWKRKFCEKPKNRKGKFDISRNGKNGASRRMGCPVF